MHQIEAFFAIVGDGTWGWSLIPFLMFFLFRSDDGHSCVDESLEHHDAISREYAGIARRS